jgi:hypothetical protein
MNDRLEAAFLDAHKTVDKAIRLADRALEAGERYQATRAKTEAMRAAYDAKWGK